MAVNYQHNTTSGSTVHSQHTKTRNSW